MFNVHDRPYECKMFKVKGKNLDPKIIFNFWKFKHTDTSSQPEKKFLKWKAVKDQQINLKVFKRSRNFFTMCKKNDFFQNIIFCFVNFIKYVYPVVFGLFFIFFSVKFVKNVDRIF